MKNIRDFLEISHHISRPTWSVQRLALPPQSSGWQGLPEGYIIFPFDHRKYSAFHMSRTAWGRNIELDSDLTRIAMARAESYLRLVDSATNRHGRQTNLPSPTSTALSFAYGNMALSCGLAPYALDYIISLRSMARSNVAIIFMRSTLSYKPWITFWNWTLTSLQPTKMGPY